MQNHPQYQKNSDKRSDMLEETKPVKKTQNPNSLDRYFETCIFEWIIFSCFQWNSNWKKNKFLLKGGILVKAKSLVAECRPPTVIYYNYNCEFYTCFLYFVHTLTSKLLFLLPLFFKQKKRKKKKENNENKSEEKVLQVSPCFVFNSLMSEKHIRLCLDVT